MRSVPHKALRHKWDLRLVYKFHDTPTYGKVLNKQLIYLNFVRL